MRQRAAANVVLAFLKPKTFVNGCSRSNFFRNLTSRRWKHFQNNEHLTRISHSLSSGATKFWSIHTHTHTPLLTHALIHPHSYKHAHTHALTHIFMLTLTLARSYTHARILTHTHKQVKPAQPRTHTHTQAHLHKYMCIFCIHIVTQLNFSHTTEWDKKRHELERTR